MSCQEGVSGLTDTQSLPSPLEGLFSLTFVCPLWLDDRRALGGHHRWPCCPAVSLVEADGTGILFQSVVLQSLYVKCARSGQTRLGL